MKEKVKLASIDLIKEKIPASFNHARSTVYTLAFEQIESLYRTKQNSGDQSFAYLFSSKITVNEESTIEEQAQMILDTNLPELIDIFDLPDDMLEDIIADYPSNDQSHSLTTSSWLPDRDENDNEEYRIDILEQNIESFTTLCEKLNNLDLSPDWIDNLKEIIDRRLRLPEWEDNFEISLVEIHLKWLHVLVLPWMSHILPATEDLGKPKYSLIHAIVTSCTLDENWFNFLRKKIKAEYVLYDMIYHLKINNIFDIIREYPTTKKAIDDFHVSFYARKKLTLLSFL